MLFSFWKENCLIRRLIILFWFCLLVIRLLFNFFYFSFLIVGNHRSLVIIMIIISTLLCERNLPFKWSVFSRDFSQARLGSSSNLVQSTIYSADYCQDSVGVIFGSSNFSVLPKHNFPISHLSIPPDTL